MKKRNDELTDLFRSRLEDVCIPVREDIWEEIERHIPIALNRRRQMIYRFSSAASVLLLLAGASAAFWVFSPKEEIADAFTQVEVSAGHTGTIGADIVKEELPAIQASTVQRQPAPHKPVTAVAEEESDEEDSFSVSFSMSFSFSESSGELEGKENGYDGHSFYAGGADKKESLLQPGHSGQTVASLSPGKQRTWGVGLFASGSVLSDCGREQGLFMLTAKDNPLNIHNAGKQGTISRSDFSSDADYANYLKVAETLPAEKQQTRVKHKLPVSFGLTVRKELSKRFALESGLVYTNLSSELTAGEGSYYKQDQTLHYLGIPLKAGITLYDTRRVNLYAAAGGMIEKCVAGNVKTTYYENGEKTHASKNSLKADPLQFSLSAALGIQYKLSDRFALYAEPGLSYHFDDGSPVSTIRKEKPLNLSMLCGVRMTY